MPGPTEPTRFSARLGRSLVAVVTVLIVGLLSVPAFATSEESLVDLIEARLALMKHVAAYKHLNDIAIEDREREAVVLAHAVAKAEAHGLDGASVVLFFTAKIDAAKAIQQCWFDRWRHGSADTPTEAPDLHNEIRPRLIIIGDKLVAMIAARAADPNGLVGLSVPAIECLPDDKAEAIAASVAVISTTPE